MTYSEIWHRIATSYDDGEARAIARILIEELFGLSYTDIVCGATEQLSADDTLRLDTAVRRIEQGEPLQHVLGYAYFLGNRFKVNSSVLIPRPETEWLVEEGAKTLANDSPSNDSPSNDSPSNDSPSNDSPSDDSPSNDSPSNTKLSDTKRQNPSKRVLDIGTGSGCIAISLKLRLADAYVEAWDISDDALSTAQDNALALNAEVVFNKRDALCAANEVLERISKDSEETTKDSEGTSKDSEETPKASEDSSWNLIVSNPPYICDSERADMADNVLQHEPHTALFVPDNDPLRFYLAIARYALLTLSEGGSLLFECNTRYADATGAMLRDIGFCGVAVSNDCFGLPRFVKGTKRLSTQGLKRPKKA